MTLRIGILGGTFDPIHHGHLFLAEEARTHFELDRVVLIPAGQPPHKGGVAHASAHHRLAMIRLAVAANPALTTSSIEVDRAGLSYTVDTLAAMGEQNAGADLYYLAGIDAIAELTTWKQPDDVVRMARIIALSRPGYGNVRLADRLPQELARCVEVLSTLQLDISSTDIRRRIAAGAAVRYLVPESVLEYIEDHHLYNAGAARKQRNGEIIRGEQD